MEWDGEVYRKFELMISKMPLFQRKVAEKMAGRQAEINAKKRGSQLIGEEDIVRAFFSEVPKPFLEMMVVLLKDVGFNYKPYQPKDIEL